MKDGSSLFWKANRYTNTTKLILRAWQKLADLAKTKYLGFLWILEGFCFVTFVVLDETFMRFTARFLVKEVFRLGYNRDEPLDDTCVIRYPLIAYLCCRHI